MIKNIGIAALFSLSLSTACAMDAGSYSQDLTASDLDEQSERCTRELGDFDGTTTPPPITIPIGQDEISAQVAIDEGQNFPDDPRAGLLAEYAVAIINVDAGADLEPGEVDLLVLAEDLLVQSDEGTLPPELADTVVDTISELSELNAVISIEVPCQQNTDQRVLDVPSADAPDERRDSAPVSGLVSSQDSSATPQENASVDTPDTIAGTFGGKPIDFD